MSPPLDWLSRLLGMMPVQGNLDLRCQYGAPWRIDQAGAEVGEMAYHVVLSGSALLENPRGGAPQRLVAGDILLLPHREAHVLHDDSGAPAVPAHERTRLNLTLSENAGTGDRLELLCGRFILAMPHERVLVRYLPARLVVKTASVTESEVPSTSAIHLAGLVELMRAESGIDGLGGQAMLNALSTAMFALILRLASESGDAPAGLLALAANPRLAPALTALFQEPAHSWTLAELASRCNMSRATLARHFQERLGYSPIELLVDIRMTLAAGELSKPAASVAAVAEAVGYQSDAAFQRAFKQHMGVTPAGWRRGARH
jgi:AraC family transcriptional activator of mtrCDE